MESERAALTEGKRAGAVDFFFGGDLNIELRLDVADDEHQGLDGIEWYGCTGLSAKEAVRIPLLLRKIEVVPTIARLNCTVTKTWTNNEDNREFHTWRAWGSRVRRKQLDYIMGPKDIRSTTWYLNQVSSGLGITSL